MSIQQSINQSMAIGSALLSQTGQVESVKETKKATKELENISKNAETLKGAYSEEIKKKNQSKQESIEYGFDISEEQQVEHALTRKKFIELALELQSNAMKKNIQLGATKETFGNINKLSKSQRILKGINDDLKRRGFVNESNS